MDFNPTIVEPYSLFREILPIKVSLCRGLPNRKLEPTAPNVCEQPHTNSFFLRYQDTTENMRTRIALPVVQGPLYTTTQRCPLWAKCGHRSSLFDHLVGAGEHCGRYCEAIAFAVLRLITSSYLVGACTGMSAGFSPLRMRST